jgi:hypothetical protein
MAHHPKQKQQHHLNLRLERIHSEIRIQRATHHVAHTDGFRNDERLDTFISLG